jgi:hypothetical protein
MFRFSSAFFMIWPTLVACQNVSGPVIDPSVSIRYRGCNSQLAPAEKGVFPHAWDSPQKPQAGDSTLGHAYLITADADSIQLVFDIELNCKGEYQVLWTHPSPDTLHIDLKDLATEKSKCICVQAIELVLRKPSHGFGQVYRLVVNGRRYTMSAD